MPLKTIDQSNIPDKMLIWHEKLISAKEYFENNLPADWMIDEFFLREHYSCINLERKDGVVLLCLEIVRGCPELWYAKRSYADVHRDVLGSSEIPLPIKECIIFNIDSLLNL